MEQPTDTTLTLGVEPECSKPVHVQRVENATNLKVIKYEWGENKEADGDTSDEDEEVVVDEESIEVDREQSDDGQNEPELRDIFSYENADPERSWLMNLLQESEHESCQPTYNHMLQMHAERKKTIFTTEKCTQNIYYGVGLLASYDKYPEVKKIRGKQPKKRIPKEDSAKSPHYSTDILDENSHDGYCMDVHLDGDGHNQDEDSSINSDLRSHVIQAGPSGFHRKKARKFKDEESKKKWEDVMTIKRKKVFTSIVKKEVSKQHRAKMNKHKEMLIQCKRAALQCQKVVRQKALHSARVVKEQQWRMKRLARENLAYWKRSKRVDREIRRKLEKEAEEQRKMDFEFIEAKRQQRKLNFLITQTELYAHFMSKKLGKGSPEEQLRILSQLDEEKNPRLANIDDYDSDLMKAKAKKNAEEAFQNERARTRNFDREAHSKFDLKRLLDSIDGEHLQPEVFCGNLKGYQLRGMNWLANLYDQGISGILADEMGLGKTVQSIAFLCHIAERYSVWGPFLIISPASTLHNWQQEIAKFVPDFKVVPYWGNPNERKILRQFWDQKDIYTKDASFHIVVTSYQIVITDIKYFNRIKWQYMILDEAQAIKSTSSMRWKTLLGFSCRNRLLLSGTPIQNSMAELWALLHFIMPTLFDSHEEFNEWFSKDIESHAENKTGIDEKHLSRLHMILKPFMLRRIKKDVENELSDKIEVMVYCPLTTRQKLLYMALKQKIRIEDLLHYTVGGGDSHAVDKNFTSNLMNLVMQFRKVCNHPELFERRNAKSPLYVLPRVFQVPFLVYDFNMRKTRLQIIQKYFSFTTEYIAHAIKNDFDNTIFNFMHAFKLSSEDLYKIFFGDLLHRWKTYYEIETDDYHSYYRLFWSQNKESHLMRLRGTFKMSSPAIDSSRTLTDLVFTRENRGQHVIYTYSKHSYYSMLETVEHRNIRSKTMNIDECEPIIDVVNDDVNHILQRSMVARERPYEERAPQVFECERTALPSFLFASMPRTQTTAPTLYCYSRGAMWDWKRFVDDYSLTSLNYHWSKATCRDLPQSAGYVKDVPQGSLDIVRPFHGWSHIIIPDKETLVTDSGKLSVLDGLLKRLKEQGHRVLIYSQMTRMIDLLEEYMWHRHHKFMRLDGSSKISERRDMVADFQARADIFVFLLSTRAGGLGINLTAADTVIFYDSDWNPTVDQQAMDRAHRLGQTKQVTVYRLICKGSIEERILQRAREKSEIQKLVISGGNFKPDTLKPKEVVSLLLDDEEIEQKYRQRTEERKQLEDMREMERKRKHMAAFKTVHMAAPEAKKLKYESSESGFEDQWLSIDSGPSSPHSDNSPVLTASEDLNDNNFLDVEGDSSINSKYTVYNLYGTTVKPRIPGRGSSKRGRPRGSRRSSALGRFNTNNSTISMTSEIGSDITVSPSTSALSSFEIPSASTSSSTLSSPQTSTNSVGYSGNPTVRRGPGRPRLKPSGPTHTGSRGPYRPRKPARPLPVPLPSDGGGNSGVSNNTGYSSYLYDYPEQPLES